MIPSRSGGGSGSSVLRYREGDVTVTLDGQLEAWVRSALTKSAGAVVKEMEAEAQKVADQAKADWYGARGVTRRTGQSGDIRVVTTVTPTEVRVGIGSTDVRQARGRFVAVYVRRPAALSLIRKEVDNDTWWATPKEMRANYRPRRAGKENPADPAGSGPYIYELNPLASDGKKLMEEFVRKPMQAKIADMPDKLRDAILTSIGGK